jgi:hypothetical protein
MNFAYNMRTGPDQSRPVRSPGSPRPQALIRAGMTRNFISLGIKMGSFRKFVRDRRGGPELVLPLGPGVTALPFSEV